MQRINLEWTDVYSASSAQEQEPVALETLSAPSLRFTVTWAVLEFIFPGLALFYRERPDVGVWSLIMQAGMMLVFPLTTMVAGWGVYPGIVLGVFLRLPLVYASLPEYRQEREKVRRALTLYAGVVVAMVLAATVGAIAASTASTVWGHVSPTQARAIRQPAPVSAPVSPPRFVPPPLEIPAAMVDVQPRTVVVGDEVTVTLTARQGAMTALAFKQSDAYYVSSITPASQPPQVQAGGVVVYTFDQPVTSATVALVFTPAAIEQGAKGALIETAVGIQFENNTREYARVQVKVMREEVNVETK